MAEGKKTKITINKDLLRLITKLKNAGVTEQKMAEHLTQLDEAKKIAKDTRKKVRSSPEPPPVGGGTSDLPLGATTHEELIKRMEEQKQRNEEELKRKAEEQLRLDKANEWKPLRDYLTMQYWRANDVVTILAGCTETGMPPTYVTSLRTDRLLKGDDKNKAQNDFNIIRKHWDGYDHPATAIHPSDVQGFTFNINKNPRVEVIYVIAWARKSGIAVPWFDWAMRNNVLSFLDEAKFKMKDKRPRTPFYKLLKRELQQAHDECRERPQAKDLIKKWYKERPEEITEWIDPTHFTYTQDDEEKTMDVDNVRSAINKYTELLK